jgi:hypothetical protein
MIRALGGYTSPILLDSGNAEAQMNYAIKRAQRHQAGEPPPDSLKTADGVAIPVWDAEATDPIAYLASVMHLLPGSATRQAVAAD